MKTLLALAAVVGVGLVSQPREAAAQYTVYRAPTVTYYAPAPTVAYSPVYAAPAPTVVYRQVAPTVVYRPVAPTVVYSAPAPVVYSAPAPVVYAAPQATVVRYRGPLGLFNRRAVVYSPGAVYPAY